MVLPKLWIKLAFRMRERWSTLLVGRLRRAFWCFQGMQIGSGTTVPSMFVTWPHQVAIGRECRIEHGVYLHYDGIYEPGPSIVFGDHCFVGANCEFNISSRLVIGDHCLIASGTVFVDHNHGIKRGPLIRCQNCDTAPIIVGDDVWIGANCVILAGVEIGRGAVVGAGAIVTKSVKPYSIVAGVPAKLIAERKQS